jgi:hypothetical protein
MMISVTGGSRTDRRFLCAVLAFILLLGSLPLTVGVIPVRGPSGPSWTLNVCHPLQSFVGASGTTVARPGTVLSPLALSDQGYASELPVAKFVNLAIAPDSPPPKALA